jgi:HK97 family phage major capsid protein
MTPEELESKLNTISENLEGKSKQEIKEVKDALVSFKAENKEAIDLQVKSVQDAFDVKFKEIQDQANALDMKMQEKSVKKAAQGDVLKKSIADNFNEIKDVRKGKTVQTKAVGNMTLGVNLTGDEPRDYNFDVVMIPNQKVNVSDLVGNVAISGGTYTYVRETGSEGAIGTPGEGLTKSQIDYDVSMIDVSTDFIAGFARYSKKMRNNLPFLQSFVPKALRRDYAKQENADFYAVLAADATASTEIITGQNKIEMLIAEIAKQEGLDYDTNAIVVTTADYWDILITEKSTGAGYGLPGVVTQDNGVLRINGIPLVKANWLPANKYFVGDWSRVNKVTTEGLSLEFSETEGTNFVANNITARIEAQVALAVEQPLALVFGDFTAV